MIFVCSRCHISGSLNNIQKEYNIQTETKKGKFSQELVFIGGYEDFENLWRPYLADYVLGLAYVVARRGNDIQNITGVLNKNSLTVTSLAWSCLGRHIKEDN